MTVTLPADAPAGAYDPALRPLATVPPGARVTFATLDARAGTLLDRPAGSPFELPAATGLRNPLTGPLAVDGAEPGDSLVVAVERVEPEPLGFAGVLADEGPFPPGRLPRSLARVCAVGGGEIAFDAGLRVPAAPMIGCAGTASEGAPGSLLAGRFGGNMDHPPLGPGARLHLPVSVPGGLLFVGDVHAAQGDGELSGFGLEIPARVTVTVELERGSGLAWPWLQTADRLIVLTAGTSFEEARDAAVEAMLRALEAQRGLEAGDAIALLSLAGDLRLGQAYGGPQITLRLEVPASLGVTPR